MTHYSPITFNKSCPLFPVCGPGEEGLRSQAPVKPQRNRKAMSCDAGINALFYVTVCLLLLNTVYFLSCIDVYECVKCEYLTVLCPH